MTIKVIVIDSFGKERAFTLPSEASEVVLRMLSYMDIRSERRRTDDYREDQQRQRAQYESNGRNSSFPGGFFEEYFTGSFPKSSSTFQPGPPKSTARKLLLAQMAGVEWSVAELMDVRKLLKRAQRKCHPDTGGSHDQWLNLQKLQAEMGL